MKNVEQYLKLSHQKNLKIFLKSSFEKSFLTYFIFKKYIILVH